MPKVPLYHLMYFLSVLHAEPFNKVYLTLLASFCMSVLSSLLGCLRLFGTTSFQLISLIFISCCTFITASLLLGDSSGAALAPTQFCPKINRRYKNFPNFPSPPYLGVFSSSVTFLFFFVLLCSLRRQSLKPLSARFQALHLLHFVFLFFFLSSSSISISSSCCQEDTSPADTHLCLLFFSSSYSLLSEHVSPPSTSSHWQCSGISSGNFLRGSSGP